MKSIRRSLKKDSDKQSPPASVSPTGSYNTSQSAGQYQQGHHVLSGANGGSTTLPISASILAPRQHGKTPPKSVIRAVASYKSRSPQEISFVENGDFFHVMGEHVRPTVQANGEQQQEVWFDAANPLTGTRGLVPAALFQVLGRNEKENAARVGGVSEGKSGVTATGQTLSPPGSHSMGGPYGNNAGGSSSNLSHRTSAGSSTAVPSPSSGFFPPRSTSSANTAAPAAAPKKKTQPLYGVVQYDFRAERADELDAKKGESIIVIAQSNHEWFVAKPIGRLGGPGLIPVSFVAISDTTTGEPLPAHKVQEMIDSGMVPPVEEWKKQTAEYKQASIPLGRFDFTNTTINTPARTSTPTQASVSNNNSSQSLPYNASKATSATSLGTSSSVNQRPTSGPGANKPFSPNSSTSSFRNQLQATGFNQSGASSGQSHAANNNVNGLASSSSTSLGYDANQRSQYTSTSSFATPVPAQEPYNRGRQAENYQGEEDLADDYYGSNGPNGGLEGSSGAENAEEYYEKYGLVTSATVESFHSEEENYWFHLRVNFDQSGYSLILYRLYDDFLEFQYALMDEHPIEAGKQVPAGAPAGSKPTRIIPKMPGPVDRVDEVVCAQRVDDLTIYLKGLCRLPDYLRVHPLFYEFFMLRPGDVEATIPDESMRIRWEAQKQRDREIEREVNNSSRQRGLDEEVVEYLDQMGNVTNGMARANLGDSGEAAGTTKPTHGQLPPLDTSSNQYNAGGYSGGTHSRQPSNQYRPPSSASNRKDSYQSPTSAHPASSFRTSESSNPMSAGAGINFISPFAPQAVVSHSTSQQTSSSAAQPPFVKIKIFHRNTDDLIAIRVPPNINLDALLDKVRERLGNDVQHIRYREEPGQSALGGNLSYAQNQSLITLPGGARLIELRSDTELDEWIRAAARLVAYVD